MRSRAIGVLLLGLVAAPSIAAPTPSTAEALSLCQRADAAPTRERRALLEQGLATAEAAVARDERDPAAHFAVFCNLGKRMRLDGASVASLFALRRLRREVDRTLELAPEHVDALLGKAALLYYTPRVLGGDPIEGERLLRRALAVAPNYIDARLALARLLSARGERGEARASAHEALDLAERQANVARVDDARRLLQELGE